MTDAHCHVTSGDPKIRELLIGRDFVGVHPWETLGDAANLDAQRCSEGVLRASLAANPTLGVGEIGLDRLKVREVPPLMREIFETQLKLAFEFKRPVVLHGAKCWGQVVQAVKQELRNQQPQPTTSTFLFHGFSRSDGLIPDIVQLGGFISVGPAILNDHAVNYRELAKKIPLENLLIETDRTKSPESACDQDAVSICDVLKKLAEIRGISADTLERITDENAVRFFAF